MKTTTLALSIAALAASAIAQSTVCPPGYESKEGAYYATRIGTYADMRIQWAEGECGAMSIKGFGMRADASTTGAQTTFHGRKWTNVTVNLSDGDHTTQGKTFSTNILSTPTQVFSGAIEFPAISSPKVGPTPWNPKYRFGFSSTYAHSGAKDLLIDIEMTGGTLDNAATWGTSYKSYFFDSKRVATSITGTRSHYGGGRFGGMTDGCKDSKATSTWGAYTYLFLANYGPTHSTTSYRDKTRAYIIGNYYPSNATVATVLGFKVNAAGVSFPGVTCNKIHVDLTAPYEVLLGKSNTNNANYRNYILGASTSTVPYNAAFVGTTIVTQSGWSDSGTSDLKISQAGATIYPAMAPTSWKRATTWVRDSTRASGSLTTSSWYFPIIRYEN